MGKIFKIFNFLIISALIFLALSVAFIALPVFGNQALIVRSGSMIPTIQVGSIIVVRPDSKIISPLSVTPIYKRGDIIAFKSEKNSKTIITHRIESYEVFNGTVFYKTKGDANEEIDNWQVDEKNILGKSFLIIPEAGKILAFAKSKYGFPALIVFPAILVIILETLNIIKEIRKHKEIKTEIRPKSNPLTFFINFKPLKIIIPILVAGLILPTTLALYADTETSSGNVLQAAAVFPTSSEPTPTETITPTLPVTPTGAPLTNQLVISEVQIDGGNGQDNDNDFIELYNPNSTPINLNGYRLVKRSGGSGSDDNIFTFTSSHIVPANGFFLWGHQSGGQNPNTYATTIGADVFSADTLGASNSIALRNGALDTGTIIDALSWDPGASSLKEGNQYPVNPQENQSLERKAYSTSTAISMSPSGGDEFKGNGFDTNDNATDFILRLTSQPQNSSSTIEIP